MAMDADKLKAQGSDEWWLKQLFDEMLRSEKRIDGKKHSRVEWFDILWGYYTGDAPLPKWAPKNKKEAAREVMCMGRANLARLSVVSLLDRVRVKGVDIVLPSTGRKDVDPDDLDDTDEAVRRLIRRNVAALQDAMKFAAAMSEGLVWVNNVNGKAVATAEDPRQAVAICDPVEPDKVIAAMKVYNNKLKGFVYAHVALPAEEGDDTERGAERVRIARRKGSTTGIGTRFTPSSWEWVDELEEEDRVGEPAGAAFPVSGRGVYVHRFVFTDGLGLYETNLDLLNRINNMIVDRLWISKFQVFRQRALKDKTTADEDDPLPDKDEKGKTIDYDALFESDPDALWKLPQGVEIWESGVTDLTPVLSAVKDDIKEFSAVSRTPLYMFSPDATGGSAEGASLARESQVFHAESIIDRWTPVVEAIAADLLAADDLDVDQDAELEAVFAPPERYSMAQRAQAATAAKATDIPTEGIWRDFWQLDAPTIARYKRYRNHDLLYGGATPPPPPGPNAPAPPPAPGDQPAADQPAPVPAPAA